MYSYQSSVFTLPPLVDNLWTNAYNEKKLNYLIYK